MTNNTEDNRKLFFTQAEVVEIGELTKAILRGFSGTFTISQESHIYKSFCIKLECEYSDKEHSLVYPFSESEGNQLAKGQFIRHISQKLGLNMLYYLRKQDEDTSKS